jgi:hypothetical protein
LNTRNSILKVLAYFDVFHHPLLLSEIREYLDHFITREELETVVADMVKNAQIFNIGPFYSLRNDVDLITRRQNGNQKASKLLLTANKIAGFLYHFPFVRAIGISGSLSKNYADAGTDIDFFIITDTNNLWLARSILHGFKKLTFLVGKQHWYCMNYFIDESSLKIPEENIFTATEVVTFMPVKGKNAIEAFWQTNEWAFQYFPNIREVVNLKEDDKHVYFFKRFVEFLLNNSVGQYFDNLLMRMTSKRWKQKEEAHKNNMKGEPIGLKIDKHIARPNPAHLQKKILNMYEERLKDHKIV